MSNKKWIQQANLKKGSLKNWFRRVYGKIAFTPKGTIKVSYLKKALKRPKITLRTKRRIQLALNFRGFKKKK